MRDLVKEAVRCMEMLDDLGIEYGSIFDWEVNTRAKRRWGQCKRNGHVYSISINKALLEETTPIESLQSTIIHELLHTVDGCFDHSTKWKSLADKVNRKYALNVKRTNSSADKGVNPISESDYKYCFKCNKCGCEVKRMRKSNFVTHYNFYKCGRCGGDFMRVK